MVPGEVDTTPYYNPDSPPGVVLVSDVQAYSAVNPNAFPVVSEESYLHRDRHKC